MMGRLTLFVAAASVLLQVLLIAVDNSEARTISDSEKYEVEIFDALEDRFIPSTSGLGMHVEARDHEDTTNTSRVLKRDRRASPRLANSLVTFRNQLNRAYPGRRTDKDGWIGNAAHQKKGSGSDHNPHVKWNGQGIVTAADFTKDIAAGVDTDRITNELQASRDNRIKYVIANGYIMSGYGGTRPWVWRRPFDYGHHLHMHISVKSDQRLGDDGREWDIPSFR